MSDSVRLHEALQWIGKQEALARFAALSAMSQSESYVRLRGGPAGRAADLRRECPGGEEDQWVNALSVIRLRHEPIEVVNEELSHQAERHDSMATDHFQIIMRAAPLWWIPSLF